MRKLITIILLLYAGIAQGQTTYQLNYDSIRVNKTAGTGGTSLYGKVYLKNVSAGLTSDSMLVVRNGRIFKVLKTNGTVTSVSGTSPISVATGTTTPVISIATANTSTTGALTNTDWNTFNDKAPINSPTFTGIPTAPTATAGTNTTQLATTAFVMAAAPTISTTTISNGGTTNGISASGGQIRLHKVTATTGGVLTTGTDTIAGSKEFVGYYIAAKTLGLTGNTSPGINWTAQNTGGYSKTIGGGLFGLSAFSGTSKFVFGSNYSGVDRGGFFLFPAITFGSEYTYSFPSSDITIAGINSPTFTGTPTAPTATAGTNTTQLATTAFVTAAVGGGAGWTTSGDQTGLSGEKSGSFNFRTTPLASTYAFRADLSNSGSGGFMSNGINSSLNPLFIASDIYSNIGFEYQGNALGTGFNVNAGTSFTGLPFHYTKNGFNLFSVDNSGSIYSAPQGTLYGTATGSITSAQLATSLTDETGTGSVVFSTSPTLVTPVLGNATGGTLGLSGALTGTTANFNNSLTVQGNGSTFLNNYGSGVNLNVICSHATQPLGAEISYSGSAPNGTGNFFLRCFDTSADRIQLRSNGGIANYSANNVNLSDIRTKKNINRVDSYWNKIKELEIVTFQYKDEKSTEKRLKIGVIAQQVEQVAPEFVSNDGFGETPKDGIKLKSVYDSSIQYATIKALQEAMIRIEALELRIKLLESKP